MPEVVEHDGHYDSVKSRTHSLRRKERLALSLGLRGRIKTSSNYWRRSKRERFKQPESQLWAS